MWPGGVVRLIQCFCPIVAVGLWITYLLTIRCGAAGGEQRQRVRGRFSRADYRTSNVLNEVFCLISSAP